MNPEYNIPEPFVFNPLKHNLNYIREFISYRTEENYDLKSVLKEIRHIGTSVMDVYSGTMASEEIFNEIIGFLMAKNLNSSLAFGNWSGKLLKDFKVVTLSDTSQWALKFHDDERRYVHLFPARSGPHSLRVKANTLKSAVLYIILIGRDYVTGNDLNQARTMLGLSPVKDADEAAAITEMIEVLRIS